MTSNNDDLKSNIDLQLHKYNRIFDIFDDQKSKDKLKKTIIKKLEKIPEPNQKKINELKDHISKNKDADLDNLLDEFFDDYKDEVQTYISDISDIKDNKDNKDNKISKFIITKNIGTVVKKKITSLGFISKLLLTIGGILSFIKFNQIDINTLSIPNIMNISNISNIPNIPNIPSYISNIYNSYNPYFSYFSLEMYKGNGYYDINDSLRNLEFDEINETTKTHIKNIDSFMKTGKEDIVVYRGLPDLYSILNENSELINFSFTSVTTDIMVAQKFSNYYKCCVIKFTLPRKIKRHVFDDDREGEILLQRNTKFIIDKSSRSGNIINAIIKPL
jgi:hypothetical protein